MEQRKNSFFLITHGPESRVNVEILERFSRLSKNTSSAMRIPSSTTIAPTFTEISYFDVMKKLISLKRCTCVNHKT
jgi:hypothetical protein